MKKLVCEICGGSLMMNSDDIAECENCGVKYSKEKIIQMVKIDGAVEITKGEVEKERIIKNAETFLELGEIDKANELFIQVSNEFPDDYRGWLGRFKIPLLYQAPSVYNLVKAQEYDNIISKLGYSTITEEIWNLFLDNKINHDFQIVEKSYTENSSTCTIIDDFSAELICFNTKQLNNRLVELQQEIGKKYVEKFLNGELLHFSFDEINGYKGSCLWNLPTYLWNSYEFKIYDSNVLAPIFNMGKINAKKLQSLSRNERCEFIKSIGVNTFNTYDEVLFLLGKTIVYHSCYGESNEIREINIPINEEYLVTYFKDLFVNDEQREKMRNWIINYIKSEPDKDLLIRWLLPQIGNNFFKIDDGNWKYKIINIEKVSFYDDKPYSSLDGEFVCQIEEILGFSKQHRSRTFSQVFENNLSCSETYKLLQKYVVEKRKKLLLCPYCGGEFVGVFKKKCKKCGIEKDY